MAQEFSLTHQDADRRLGWLGELAATLESARDAVLHFNLTEFIVQTARQRELCTFILQAMDQSSCPHGEPWNHLLKESQQLAMRIHYCNREYCFLLAHARRMVDIYCRVLENSQVTYLPLEPKPACGQRCLEG